MIFEQTVNDIVEPFFVALQATIGMTWLDGVKALQLLGQLWTLKEAHGTEVPWLEV